MTKETLTIQHIQIDLRRQLRLAMIITVVFAILFGLLLLAIVRFYMEYGTLAGMFSIVLYGLLCLMIAVVGAERIYMLCSALNKPGRIVKDRVVGKEVRDHLTRYRLHQTYHLRFAGYGEYVIPTMNHSWSDLYALGSDMIYVYAECDDEFYLVLSKPHTGKILLAYNTKMFDYRPPQPK